MALESIDQAHKCAFKLSLKSFGLYIGQAFAAGWARQTFQVVKNINFSAYLNGDGSSAFLGLGRRDIGPIAKHFYGRIDPLHLRLLLLVNIVSLNIIVAVGFAPIFCRGAIVGRSGLAAGPYRRRRRSNRTSGFTKGTRALPEKSARRRG